MILEVGLVVHKVWLVEILSRLAKVLEYAFGEGANQYKNPCVDWRYAPKCVGWTSILGLCENGLKMSCYVSFRFGSRPCGAQGGD